jgi:hypothetical protein
MESVAFVVGNSIGSIDSEAMEVKICDISRNVFDGACLARA